MLNTIHVYIENGTNEKSFLYNENEIGVRITWSELIMFKPIYIGNGPTEKRFLKMRIKSFYVWYFKSDAGFEMSQPK